MIRVEQALAFIPSHDRETWVRMGMAIKSEFGDSAFDLWDRWSESADSYRAASARSVWRSFRGRGVTIASLFSEARAHGWKGDGQPETPRPAADPGRTARLEAEERETAARREKARQRAAWIVSACSVDRHPYLERKGFTRAKGLVWQRGEQDLVLAVPMRANGRLVNVQLIDAEGEKKFLPGGQAGGAEMILGPRFGTEIVCEGYATGLSVLEALKKLCLHAKVHVTFSAMNMVRIAKGLKPGLVIADNDVSETGLKAAEKIGWRYWMSDVVGEDFNDFWRRVGTFAASASLRKAM